VSAPPATDPLQLRFEEIARYRPWALLAPYVEHDLADPPVPAPGELAELGPGPRAPTCAVVAEIAAAGPDGVLRLGLAGGGVHVLGTWDAAAGTVAVEVVSPRGSVSLPARVGDAAPSSHLTGIAVVVNSDHVTVLVRTGSGDDASDWRPVLTEADRVRELVELCDPAVLGALRYVHGSSGEVRLARLQAGYSGQVGVRDPQVVRTADGRPLVRDGKVWLTLTDAGFGFLSRAHWGVWTLDLADPTRLEQVGALFFARDGLVLGDHAGQLVVDEATGTTTVLVSSWGDFSPEVGVHVRHLTTEEDLLSGVHVLESHRLELPTRQSSCWDPTLARVDGRWHLGFVECLTFGPPRYVFRPALARTDDDDPTRGLVRVGADEVRRQTEGTVLQRFGDRWYLLASDRDAADYPVYDPATMVRTGSLRAPYGTNIPHPMVLPNGLPGQAPWWLVTFDGTTWHEDVLGYGTHGDVLVMAGVPAPAEEPGRGAPGGLGRLARGVLRRLGGRPPA
jgi:hypothetical protein